MVLLDGDLWIEMVQSRGMTADSSGKGAVEHAAGDLLVPRVDVGAMGPLAVLPRHPRDGLPVLRGAVTMS